MMPPWKSISLLKSSERAHPTRQKSSGITKIRNLCKIPSLHGAQFPIRHASGHVNRVDECICPVDFDWTEERAIRDKQFNYLFNKVPKDIDLKWLYYSR